MFSHHLESDSTKDSDRQESPSVPNSSVQIETIDNFQLNKSGDGLTVTTSSTENIQLDDHPKDSNNSDDPDDNTDGENSVFEKSQLVTALPPKARANIPKKRAASADTQEEVDDIELIFSSDDKDFPQGDLVSISDYEPWQKSGTSGTPVLVNFGRIASDHESDNTKMDDSDVFYSSAQMSMAQEQSLDSNDSLSEPRDTHGANTENIEPGMSRDDSLDTFEQVVLKQIFPITL